MCASSEAFLAVLLQTNYSKFFDNSYLPGPDLNASESIVEAVINMKTRVFNHTAILSSQKHISVFCFLQCCPELEDVFDKCLDGYTG